MGKNREKEPDCLKSGKIILDATCAPADIQYPIGTRLLNEAREKLEEIMDVLHKPDKGIEKKQETIGKKDHESYISFTKFVFTEKLSSKLKF